MIRAPTGQAALERAAETLRFGDVRGPARSQPRDREQARPVDLRVVDQQIRQPRDFGVDLGYGAPLLVAPLPAPPAAPKLGDATTPLIVDHSTPSCTICHWKSLPPRATGAVIANENTVSFARGCHTRKRNPTESPRHVVLRAL